MCQEQGEFHKLLLELRNRFKIYFMMTAAQFDKMLKAHNKIELAQLPRSCGFRTATGSMVDTYTHMHTHTVGYTVRCLRETSSLKKMLTSLPVLKCVMKQVHLF